MIKKRQSAVVTPVYKPLPELTKEEVLSLESACKNLNSYDHILIGPKEMDWQGYQNFYSHFGINVKFEIFKSFHFNNTDTYNKLLKSLHFYARFKRYNYILIHQTDAYIFTDQLTEWCNKKYDFIGAPWIEGFGNSTGSDKIIGVGNGGFSLRNIDASLRLLKRVYFLKMWRYVWFKTHLQALIRFVRVTIFFKKYFQIYSLENLNAALLGWPINEDYYWSQIIPSVFTDYKVAIVEDAVKFSFETNPSFFYEMNNNHLPFGCHAWQKYEPDFWSKFIK